MKFLSGIFIATVLLAFPASLAAQTTAPKLAHVNINKVLEGMDGYKTAEKKLQDFASQLQETLDGMQQEYYKKVQELDEQKDDLLPAIYEAKVSDINDLQDRIIKLQGSSDQQLMQKQMELISPLEKEVMDAIKQVANEKGFSYIFDSSAGTLLYYPEEDDVTDLVKAKLGIQ